MTLRARLAVAALLVVGVLVGAGLLLPQTVRASAVAEVDRQLTASLPLALALSSGAPPPVRGVGVRVPALSASSPFGQVYVARLRECANRSGSAAGSGVPAVKDPGPA
jgi:hypothetical protein